MTTTSSNTNAILSDAGVHGLFEPGKLIDTFEFVKPADVVFSTLKVDDGIVISTGREASSTAPPYSIPAGLYVSDNRVGVRKIPFTGTSLDVGGGGAIGGGGEGMVLYSNDYSNVGGTVLRRVGDCLSACHSNLMLSSNAQVNAYADAKGAWQSRAGVFEDVHVPVQLDAKAAVVDYQVSNASDPSARILDVRFQTNHRSAEITALGLDCATPGDVFRIGNTMYVCASASWIDEVAQTMSLGLRDAIGDGKHTTVDEYLQKAVAQGSSAPPQDREVKVSRFRKTFEHVITTAPFEAEDGQFSSLSLEPFQFSPRAADTQVRLEDGRIILEIDDGDLWKARLLLGNTVDVGEALGVYYVTSAQAQQVQGGTAYDVELYPLDGRSETTTASARNRIRDAIDAGNEDEMPRLFPNEMSPVPEDIVLTQTSTLFSTGTQTFVMQDDVFSEPLGRFLNDVDLVPDGGNPVRHVRFAADASSTRIPIVACYKHDGAIRLRTSDAGAAAFQATGLDLASMSSVDVRCTLSGFPFSLTDVSVSADSRYIVLRGPQFTRQETKEALLSVRSDDSKLRTRGRKQLVVSDGPKTTQWLVCDVNPDANRVVMRKKSGAAVGQSDVTSVPRTIYVCPIQTRLPTTITERDQPEALVVNASLCVGGRDSAVPTRSHGKGDAFNLFGNMFTDGGIFMADPHTDEQWRVGVTRSGGFEIAVDRRSDNFDTALYITPGGKNHLTCSADLHARGDVYAARFKQASDVRLKKSLRDIREGRKRSLLDDFAGNELSVMRYQMIGKEGEDERIGLLAQQAERLFPEAVSSSRALVPMRRAVRFVRLDRNLSNSDEAWCSAIYEDDGSDASNDFVEGDEFSSEPPPRQRSVRVSVKKSTLFLLTSKEGRDGRDDDKNDARALPVAITARWREADDVRMIQSDTLLYYTMATVQDLLRSLGYGQKDNIILKDEVHQ